MGLEAVDGPACSADESPVSPPAGGHAIPPSGFRFGLFDTTGACEAGTLALATLTSGSGDGVVAAAGTGEALLLAACPSCCKEVVAAGNNEVTTGLGTETGGMTMGGGGDGTGAEAAV